MSPAYAPLRTVVLVRRLPLFHWGLAQTISIASLAQAIDSAGLAYLT